DAAPFGARLGLEPARAHLVIALERHRDAADEHVALLLGVLHEHPLQLVEQGVLPGAEAVVVLGVEVDGEDVRGQRARAVEHLDLVVALALEALCRVERLQLPAPGREDARHAAIEAALDPIQDPHGGPSLSQWLTDGGGSSVHAAGVLCDGTTDDGAARPRSYRGSTPIPAPPGGEAARDSCRAREEFGPSRREAGPWEARVRPIAGGAGVPY